MPSKKKQPTSTKPAATTRKTKATVGAQRPTKAAAAKKPATVATTKKAATPGQPSRKDSILALISRKTGATLPELMEATTWQAHSVRGFIATLGTKHGLKITSAKNEAGQRVYTQSA